MTKEVERHRRAIIDAAARHGARNVRVFGSAAHGEDRSDSDIDLLVEMAEDSGMICAGPCGVGLPRAKGRSGDHPGGFPGQRQNVP